MRVLAAMLPALMLAASLAATRPTQLNVTVERGGTMAKHYFVVEVEADTAEQAQQVIAERINFDEDYQFDYKVRQVTCDCCGRAVPTPYHHDAHDDSGNSWDYCQDCEDAGCDLVDCVLR